MTTDAKPDKVKSPDRQDRLAERLRENLRKRKEQARAREPRKSEPQTNEPQKKEADPT